MIYQTFVNVDRRMEVYGVDNPKIWRRLDARPSSVNRVLAFKPAGTYIHQFVWYEWLGASTRKKEWPGKHLNCLTPS